VYYEGPEGDGRDHERPRWPAGGRDTAAAVPLHTQEYVVNQPHNVEVAARGEKFLVNAIVGDSDNVPLEVTVNWTASLKP